MHGINFGGLRVEACVMAVQQRVLAAVVEMQVAVDDSDHVVNVDAELNEALVKLGSFRLVQVVDDRASVPDTGVHQNGSVRMTDREPVDRHRRSECRSRMAFRKTHLSEVERRDPRQQLQSHPASLPDRAFARPKSWSVTRLPGTAVGRVQWCGVECPGDCACRYVACPRCSLSVRSQRVSTSNHPQAGPRR